MEKQSQVKNCGKDFSPEDEGKKIIYAKKKPT
jgi:hypothetical protein